MNPQLIMDMQIFLSTRYKVMPIRVFISFVSFSTARYMISEHLHIWISPLTRVERNAWRVPKTSANQASTQQYYIPICLGRRTGQYDRILAPRNATTLIQVGGLIVPSKHALQIDTRRSMIDGSRNPSLISEEEMSH